MLGSVALLARSMVGWLRRLMARLPGSERSAISPHSLLLAGSFARVFLVKMVVACLMHFSALLQHRVVDCSMGSPIQPFSAATDWYRSSFILLCCSDSVCEALEVEALQYSAS